MFFLVNYLGKDSSGTIYVAFRDPGQILKIRDCPRDFRKVRAYADGKYRVKLPWRDFAPELGNSRELAHKRFLQNERSLMKKGEWPTFSAAVQEYGG